jgi:lysophospholipase L1-like esterase
VQADGLHPNAAAVDLVAASILPHVEAALPPLRDLAA